MQTRRDLTVNYPALIPIAGCHDKRPRALDRDVTTIGRARGTDFCMEANEISTLHCVIFRTPEGYRIRDCNSRCGTRINGESIKNSLLRDGDIINLGPFSLEFRVPTALFPNDGARLDPVQVARWKDSRRRLAQRALKLRTRLNSKQAASPREQEWMQKANLLKEKIRSYDQRLGELEAAEEELTQERHQVAKEAELERQRVQKIEGELAERLAQADQEIHDRWQEFQVRCHADEISRANSTLPPADPGANTPHDGASSRLQEKIDLQNREHLQQQEEQLHRRHAQWQREQQEFNTMKEQWVQDQAKASTTLEQQMAALGLQKAELMRMMANLKQMQADLRKQAKPDVRALQDDLERLQQENADLRTRLEESAGQASAPTSGDEVHRQVEDLRAEIELLHEELDQKDQTLNNLQQGAGQTDAVLRAENAELRKQIEELSSKSQQAPKNESDLERYEAELNEFRRQLESDRAKLNKEVEVLRDRNQELDEAIREMEMEMSKERAELARERMKLDRVREEVKGDAERLQREMAVRDSMAPVQKLRDELTGKQPPAGKGDKALNDRLRGIRNQLSDTPTAAS